jgi:hypothetical protein
MVKTSVLRMPRGNEHTPKRTETKLKTTMPSGLPDRNPQNVCARACASVLACACVRVSVPACTRAVADTRFT